MMSFKCASALYLMVMVILGPIILLNTFRAVDTPPFRYGEEPRAFLC
jgi:hypothetical protein